jgi:tetratricopeptide (TPR) repeat protein
LLTDEVQKRDEFLARQTDQEILQATQQVDFQKWQRETEKALGFAEPSIPVDKPPSYTLTLEEIRKLYENKEFERALILVNKMLGFYPRSAQYLMMKGTLHQRLEQDAMALQSYEKAFEISPSEKLKVQISHLKRKHQHHQSLQGRQL